MSHGATVIRVFKINKLSPLQIETSMVLRYKKARRIREIKKYTYSKTKPKRYRSKVISEVVLSS